MIDEKLVENYEDAQMALLMDAYAKAEGEALMAEAEKVEAPFSEEFKAQCMELIDKEFAKRRRKKWLRSAAKKAVKAAVIVFAVVGILSVGAMSVQAIRIPVVNFFLEQSEKFTTIFFGTEDPTDATDNMVEGMVQEGPLAGLLPDEFSLDSYDELENNCVTAVYIHEQGDYIFYSTNKWDGLQLSIDTEDADYYAERPLGNHNAYVVIKGQIQIMWVNEKTGVVYEMIASSIDMDSFWSLAEKIAAKS